MESWVTKILVHRSSHLYVHSADPSATLKSRAVTRILWPSHWMLVSSTASTPCSRPAATGSCSGLVYLRTALIGRTTICLVLSNLVINVSAIPSASESSRFSATSGLKGSTAIDLITGWPTGGCCLLDVDR